MPKEPTQRPAIPRPGPFRLEVELDRQTLEGLPIEPVDLRPADDQEAAVDKLMTPDPVVVAPEDTLGEVAERLLERGTTAAAVAEYGRLIGILTAGDLVRASAMRVHPSEGRARQWMTAEPITVSPQSSVGRRSPRRGGTVSITSWSSTASVRWE